MKNSRLSVDELNQMAEIANHVMDSGRVESGTQEEFEEEFEFEARERGWSTQLIDDAIASDEFPEW